MNQIETIAELEYKVRKKITNSRVKMFKTLINTIEESCQAIEPNNEHNISIIQKMVNLQSHYFAEPSLFIVYQEAEDIYNFILQSIEEENLKTFIKNQLIAYAYRILENKITTPEISLYGEHHA